MKAVRPTTLFRGDALLLVVAGLTFVAIVLVGVAVTGRPEDNEVVTSRQAVEPADLEQGPSPDDPLGTDEQGSALPDAPPALAYLDESGSRTVGSPFENVDGPSESRFRSSRASTDGTAETRDVDEQNGTEDLPWDDSQASTAGAQTTDISSASGLPTTSSTAAPTTSTAPDTTTSSVPPSKRPDSRTKNPTSSSTTAAPATTSTVAASTTTTTTAPPTTTTTTTTPTTTTKPPAGTKGRAGYIAPSAPTYIPVYDTAWQMMVRSTPSQADNYFAALKANGFSGTWSGIIHHAPATYNLNFAGGGQVGSLQNGELVLSDDYIAHARQILDAADRHGMKVGLVAAWQNLYLPGGGADNGVGSSDAVRGSITTANAYAYGRHIAEEFGDHPAVSMWVFGGDAGTNNTEANKAVWREMARGVRDAGNGLSITYHTPTSEFNQLNYAGEPWLDFIAPETGHAQTATDTENELRTVKSTYGLPVWQGEPRYYNINFDWVNAAFRNPGVNEVRDDAQAAENAGVSGYVYGDAGRWTWCAGYGDSTPCNANDVASSFGAGEAAVIDVFRK